MVATELRKSKVHILWFCSRVLGAVATRNQQPRSYGNSNTLPGNVLRHLLTSIPAAEVEVAPSLLLIAYKQLEKEQNRSSLAKRLIVIIKRFLKANREWSASLIALIFNEGLSPYTSM